MGNSLQDQLLKAGLIDEKQAQKAAKSTHKKRKQKNKNQGKKKGPVEIDQAARELREQVEAKKAKDRALEEEKKRQARHRAIAAEIAQLIEQHQVERAQGEVAYQFQLGGKIKKLYTDDAQRQRIVKGELAVVRSANKFFLVPAEIGHKIGERNAKALLVLNDKPAKEAEKPAEDDPYAEFQVPDDLMW